jgi:hypothetical protein
MRNSFLIFLTCLIPAIASDTLSVENGCVFWGSRPDHSTVWGDMTVYHGEDFKFSGTLGQVLLWEGSGPVWVVWSSDTEPMRHRIRVNGNFQTCFK